jgi:DNA-binding MarR family transcriptional regulator
MKRGASPVSRRNDESAEPGQEAAREAADRLHSAAIHLLRRLRRTDPVTGLPAPQLSALSVIVFRGPLTLGALAAAEQVRPPSMTRVVRALEQAGLAERQVDPNDRRSVFITATALGEQVLQEGRLRRVQTLANEISALTDTERQTLEQGLGIIEKIAGPRHSSA